MRRVFAAFEPYHWISYQFTVKLLSRILAWANKTLFCAQSLLLFPAMTKVKCCLHISVACASSVLSRPYRSSIAGVTLVISVNEVKSALSVDEKHR